MKWFYNLKISRKLISAFVVVSLLAGALGVIGVMNINKSDKAYSGLYRDYGAGMAELGYAGMDIHKMRVTVRDMILHTASQDIDKDVSESEEI